ncbi:ABC transporter permease [Fulvivirga sp. 29W222]|uniref:ABC transporter permease n=1 Tax=Fulvivirga marina TaxID=2494733 RepID=A0A937G359_9BACT|nr:ABC transporter permease [Fulvivirga marina]MBL6449145.1 ABC transporter permease [Fulvivirga marina]
MFRNYLKVAFKNILRQKLIVLINVIGLSAALACCIIAYLSWKFDHNFNAFHVNVDRIFKVNSVANINGVPVNFAITPLPLSPAMKTEIEGIETSVRYTETREELIFGDETYNNKLGFVDPDFLDVFTFKIIQGNKLAKGDKSKVLISRKMAEKHFSGKDAIGETITVNYKNIGERSYTVNGVLDDIPLNSSFNFDMLLLFDNFLDLAKLEEDDWASFVLTTFILMKDASEEEKVEGQLGKYAAIQSQAREDLKMNGFYLDPLPEMAGNLENLRGNVLRQGLPSSAVITPIVMAVLMLLLSCFNFVNSAMAMSGKRLKEIGLRKVFGGTKNQVMIQFLTENLVVCLIAICLAIVLASFLVPAYSALWSFLELEFNFFESPDIILLSVVLLIVTAVLAGAYPAFYVGSFDPTKIFRENFKRVGTNVFMRFLLLFQLSIVLLSLIAGLAFNENAEYQQTLDMGFDHQQTIVVQVNNKSEYDIFANRLTQEPKILSVSGSEGHIGRNIYTSSVQSGDREERVEGINVSPEFLETASLTILEGRNFEQHSARDRSESVLVTESFVKEFGWEEPLNKKIIVNDTLQLFVIGVVKNIYMRGLWQPVKPLFLRMADEDRYHFITAKVNPEDRYMMRHKLEQEWKETFPNIQFHGYLQEEMLYEAKTINSNIETVFFILAMVSLFISSSGLFSMLSLNIAKRSKEFGIRKVLGGSKTNIAFHITKEFMIILLISMFIGIFAASYFVDWLLDSIYTYHTQVNIFAIFSATILLFGIFAITVGYKVIKTAMESPVKVIRNS